ncbi:hypothetical protein [Bifidobacterium sp. N5G01]|uniref:hypothetical protein n=1 Tax=Bifidobacterium sp. N5G01 TaxID=2013021 RepID=UPI000C147261|nr:hypothetical protein [Bifidobacterium sp. N5G01]PIB81459.1 hypothetical protein CE168_07420 [Bifidobacterium sp. N5G01]
MATTTINISIRLPKGDGTTDPAVGSLIFQPERHHFAGTDLILPKPFKVDLDKQGKATVKLENTDGRWVWKVAEMIGDTVQRIRYFELPAGNDTANYSDLSYVDGGSFTPLGQTSPLTELTDEDIDWISQFVAAGTHLAN